MSDWTNFETDAEALSGTNYQRCGVSVLLDTLGEDARKGIEAALRRPDLTSAAIMASIKKRVPTRVSEYTLRRHRKGACTCERSD